MAVDVSGEDLGMIIDLFPVYDCSVCRDTGVRYDRSIGMPRACECVTEWSLPAEVVSPVNHYQEEDSSEDSVDSS